MIHFEPVNFATPEWRQDFQGLSNRTIYQDPAWLSFVAETQRAEPIVARIVDGDHVGYFTGLITRPFGLRVLGSPFPGWSTAYMGFVLPEGFPRPRAMKALMEFGFKDLDCAHVECMDRQLSLSDAANMGLEYNTYTSFEVDLRPDEKVLLSNMAHEKRTNLRKAAKNGLTVEQAQAEDETFADEYYAQLCEVFHRQGLAPTYPLERVRALIKHLMPTGKLLLLRVRSAEGRCIATNISLAEGNRGYVWGAASWHDSQIQRPNELIFWYTFRHWKARGVEWLDLTGNSDYKARYGAYRIHLPWIRKSRYPLVSYLRDSAKQFFRLKQRLSGRWFSDSGFPQLASGPSDSVKRM